MFRNQYDTDVTTFSPHGRVFQMEYAMEAVKQGTACIGLYSCTHVVLVAVNKPASELSSYQRKEFRVADHVGVAFSGLTADGRVLIKFLRSECINHAFVYEAPLPVSRLALRLADKEQMIDAERIQAIIDSMEAAEEAPSEPSSMQEEDKGSAAAPMDI